MHPALTAHILACVCLSCFSFAGGPFPGSVATSLPEPPAAPPSDALSPTLNITVKRLDGSEISFEVLRAETVRDIKARLEVWRASRVVFPTAAIYTEFSMCSRLLNFVLVVNTPDVI